MACPDKYKEMCSFYKYYRSVQQRMAQKTENLDSSVPVMVIHQLTISVGKLLRPC